MVAQSTAPGGGKLSPGHGEKKRVAKIADNGWQASVCSLSKKKVMPRGGELVHVQWDQ
jgi:hypothetical protein